MSQAQEPNRLKAALPAAAAAAAVIAAGVGGTLLASNTAPAPAASESTEEAIVTSEAQPPPPGSSIPGVAFDQAPSAGATSAGVEIVVKFKDDKKVKDIVDAFWKDQGAARSKFDVFKSSRPEFADLRLDRVTYSNELVLVPEGSLAPASRIASMRALAARLKDVSDISYAEPNLTAQPGEPK